jgi:hypothetical protein
MKYSRLSIIQITSSGSKIAKFNFSCQYDTLLLAPSLTFDTTTTTTGRYIHFKYMSQTVQKIQELINITQHTHLALLSIVWFS